MSGSATYIAQWSQDEYTVTYQPGEHGTFEEASTAGLHYGDATPEGPNAAENHEPGVELYRLDTNGRRYRERKCNLCSAVEPG